MLIIGKSSQRDYYDYIATQYGPDKGVVFKREISTVEFPKASYGKYPEAVPFASISIKNNLKNTKYSSIAVIPFVVVVGDFYWSGVKIVRYKNDTLGNIDYVSFLYTEEELQDFLLQETLINDLSGGYDREMSYFKGQSYYYLRENTNKTAAFFKSGKRPEWVPKECVVGYGPYSHKYDITKNTDYVGAEDGISGSNDFLMNHWKLNDVKFSTVLSPEEAYTHIYNYIQHNSIPEMVEVSDKTKIIKSGFDMKQSFRHRK